MGVNLTWAVASIAGASLWLTFVVIRYLGSTQRPKDFPPGPPTVLGLGNLTQIPLKQPFVKFHEWSKTYGDIIGLKVGPSNLVILHSPQYVRELFDKRGALYSGRPYSYIPFEHVFQSHSDKHILAMQNGPGLRRWRTATATLVGPAGLKNSLPMQEATSTMLAYKLLTTTPPDTLDHLKNWALATPLLAITGQRLEDRGKAYADRFFHAQKLWLQLLEPGNAPPVDMFPFLRWVPERFADWKTKARYVQQYMHDEYSGYLKTSQELCDTANDGKFHGLMTKILENNEGEKAGDRLTPEEVAYLGGGLLDAAVDTTWATIMSFVLFMAAFPAIQDKAREEIDRLSASKPPEGSAIKRMPYLRACLLEVFRLRPPAPNGLPHVLDADDTFCGYKIPKGTTLLANVWGIQRNPDEYDRPEEFLPERYLRHPLGLKPEVAATEGQRATYTFGAGRRVCPGEQFAHSSILVAMAKLLWAFKITAPKPLDLDIESGYHTGLVLSPEAFDVDFGLRDESKRSAVVADYEASLSVRD